jgi:hypothetical protein
MKESVCVREGKSLYACVRETKQRERERREIFCVLVRERVFVCVYMMDREIA